MISHPGWYTDPISSARLRWWDGSRWSDSTAPAPAPTTRETTYSHRPASGKQGFPFVRPWARDWVFYWALFIMLASVLALVPRDHGDATTFILGFATNLAIGLPLNFVIFVLPVAAVRSIVRSLRLRDQVPEDSYHVAQVRARAPRTEEHAPPALRGHAGAGQNGDLRATTRRVAGTLADDGTRRVRVDIDGGQITFTRRHDGDIHVSARGFQGSPSARTVYRAKRELNNMLRAQRLSPWF